MSEMSYRARAGLAGLALLAAHPLITAQAADGDQLYKSKGCYTCHGMNPDQPVLPVYPKLAGQNPAYLLQQMKDIRDGKRANGLSATMVPTTSNVTDEEFEAIADWLASQ